MVETYIPGSVLEAVEVLDKNEVRILAGGTDLMARHKRWSGLVPHLGEKIMLIDRIDELRQIKESDGWILIGSCTTSEEIEKCSLLPESLRVASRMMASPAIRNSATIGGNIVNASPAGDLLPPLYSFESILVLESVNGEREVPIEKFIYKPGKVNLLKNEILKYIKFKRRELNKEYYKKVGTRKSTALSKLSFCGILSHEGEQLTFNCSFGAVGPTIVYSRRLEHEISMRLRENAQGDNEEFIKYIIKSYSSLIKPISDQRSTREYRKEVSLRLLQDFMNDIF